MYHGLHPNANPLQQTYDQLQTRAIQELNDEITRLKDIILDKDGEIAKLKEITNEGTLQKRLAHVLEQNNNLKLQIKEDENNKALIKDITDSLNRKNDELYRVHEKMNLLNEEYKELMHNNKGLNQELIRQTQITTENRHKDDQIVALERKIDEFETLIHDLKKATKVNDLETEIHELKHQIDRSTHEKQILSQNNKHLTTIYDQMKAKYTKLLNDFDTNVQQNELKSTKRIDSLAGDVAELNDKYNSEKRKNDTLKTQMKDTQASLTEMEQLNLKLIKGYNIEDVINDLQHEKNQNINLQNELKQITKQLCQKEKTNLVLLKRNNTLTQTLSGDTCRIDEEDEESTHFDHMDQIQLMRENIQNLHQKIDKLESDKYRLLTQIHEHDHADDDDALAVSGLTKQQRTKVKHFVKELRKRSLMPHTWDEDDEDEDGSYVKLKKENETLRQWKDTLMTKLLETQGATAATTVRIAKEVEDEDANNETQVLDTKQMILDMASKERLMDLLGVSGDEMDVSQKYCARIKELTHEHKAYVDVVLQVMEHESLNNIQNIEIVRTDEDGDGLRQLKQENNALLDEIENLKGYKVRHAKIDSILKEKDESELIKKVDEVSKENMVLIVNQKKLSTKYVEVKKQQKYLFNQYTKLLQYLMQTEQYLWHKLSETQRKNEHLSIFMKGLLQNIASKMVPLNEYRNVEIECQSLYQTKQHLLSIVDRFQSYSMQYFECKRNNIDLTHQLMNKTERKDEEDDGDETVYNAEMIEEEEEKEHKGAIQSSIKTTEEEYAKTQKKYEHVMTEMKEVEQNSAKLHSQITELRSICLDQSNTIASLKKQMNSDKKRDCDSELQGRFDALKIEYESKLVDIEQLKQKTEFAVSSLQTLQTKMLCALNIDEEDEDDACHSKIEHILRKTQSINDGAVMKEERVKALGDKVCGLEVEILKAERKYNELQSQHFNVQKAKRFLEANFNCIYSKTLHKMSTKYLSEIDHLRNTNEELYESLHEEQSKTKAIYSDMMNHKILIESCKVKMDNLNVLMQQYEAGAAEEYVKNWQNKCTNLEIKQIELLHHNESLQNEIGFVRNENHKYLANIGSLQKKLSVSNQELQDTKHEMVKKYHTHQLQALQEIETEHKSIQTQDAPSVNKTPPKMDKLQSKIVSLQSMIRTLQNESIHTEERVNGATEGLQIMLQTAQETIGSLQTLVTQKNESIEEYKEMMDKLLRKLKEQQTRYAQHIHALKVKHNVDQRENEQMIAMKDHHDHHISEAEWVQFSAMKTTMHEKDTMIRALQSDEEENETQIEILKTRIDEYHHVIQQLNDKVLDLSDSLRAFKSKLNAKKKENLHLQKAVKTLKQNMEKKRDNQQQQPPPNDERKENEMDDKMRKMEDEYRVLRCSLRSELDENTHKLNQTQMKKKKLMTRNNDLVRQMEKVKDNLQNKSNLIHKLQLQVSKIQKDKITMQEKHSLALKLNKKKQNHVEKALKTAQSKAESEETQIKYWKKKVDEKQSELNRLNTTHEKLIKLKKTQEKEIAQLKIESDIEADAAGDPHQILQLKKEIERLQTEAQSLQRKYDFVVNESDNKMMIDEMERNENKMIELQSKITELQFDREDMEIKYNKVQKELRAVDAKKVIASRNDPELQNLLDSMRFIINKLKKENQGLKDKQNQQKQTQSLRITNLLKENRVLKKKVNEGREKKHEMEEKQFEIERISNLNKRLKKENHKLKETNTKYIKSDSVKKEQQINHLRAVIENERNSLKERVNETEMIWKRKIAVSNDDLVRLKKMKKDLQSELQHKNEMNHKMSQEIKALIELIDHTKNVSKKHNQNQNQYKKQIDELKKENVELRSELSAFDVTFFNEIEDLKYREAQAQQMINDLQSQLAQNNQT
eukprot:270873_1